MFIAHPFAGLIVTNATKSFWKNLSVKEEKLVWITGITASVISDFDLLIAFFFDVSSHHQLITHTLNFYLFLGLIGASILYLLEKRNFNQKKIDFAEKLLIVFIVNTLFHVLTDIVVGKIKLFWPIYNETISIINIESANWFENYMKSPAILEELIFIIMGLYLSFKNRKNKNFKTGIRIKLLWFIIASFLTIFCII